MIAASHRGVRTVARRAAPGIPPRLALVLERAGGARFLGSRSKGSDFVKAASIDDALDAYGWRLIRDRRLKIYQRYNEDDGSRRA